MPAKILIPKIVRDDLDHIGRYVGQGGNALALEWLDYMQKRINMLTQYPLIGPAYDTTYRKLQARSFWILYRVDKEDDPSEVTLVRIIHHKQDIQSAIETGQS